jgi:3-hydroxyacyl-CoA dehydrogenase/enoyl-CoA hydratase/3-hydroxybutyryl-CoA epimerase
VHPVLIDNMGKAVGMPVGPLQVYDEVSMELSRKAWETWRRWACWTSGATAACPRGGRHHGRENGRGGRHHGGGFYEYAEDGSKAIWPKLFDLYYKSDVCLPEQDIKDRLLFRQVIEALKCLESGVLRSEEDGNIGSIMGIGAPVWTGGLLQFVKHLRLRRFVERCRELAAPTASASSRRRSPSTRAEEQAEAA